jgi:DNA-directed RNA polymerase specialized sigma24 family protein
MAGETSSALLQNIWKQLSAYHDWQLVADEATFFARVVTIATTLTTTDLDERKLARAALMRGYGEFLHKGLLARQERAAVELWLAFRRLGLRRRRGTAAAEELAQEAMRRVLDSLPQLRSPQSLIFWAFRIFYTVAREYDQHDQTLTANTATQVGDRVTEIPDPSDMAELIEGALVGEQLWTLLEAKLPNPLERLVLLRVIGLGDHPRDVARDLGLPLHRARLAKSRAIKRLRDDDEIMQVLRELTADQDQDPERGASDDEPPTE